MTKGLPLDPKYSNRMVYNMNIKRVLHTQSERYVAGDIWSGHINLTYAYVVSTHFFLVG